MESSHRHRRGLNHAPAQLPARVSFAVIASGGRVGSRRRTSFVKQAQPSGNGGTLFLVATPIGNLEDLTYRAVRVLSEVDLIAAEDTRRTRRLLDRHGVSAPMTRLFEHNERARAARADPAAMHSGRRVAVVTDAGSPGVSDPGYPLVRAAVAEGIRVEKRSGAERRGRGAAGERPADRRVHLRRVPAGPSARRGARRLEELRERRETVVAFESPHRIDAQSRRPGRAVGGTADRARARS